MSPALLLTQTLTLCAALLLLALLRRPLLARFDARAVYLGWLIVPAALLAALLPLHLAWTAPPLVTQVWQDALGTAAPGAAADLAGAAPALGLPQALALAWLAVALLMAAAMAWQQRHFSQRLRRGADGELRLPAGDSACIVGLWHPQLALPADFEQRFPPEQRELILAHEAEHLRRRDPLANLLAAALCCLHWFNPLAWWALRRFRADQELACDAVVLIERRPQADLRSYAEALVRSHEQASRALLPPLASPWRSGTGLVERVARLPQHARRRGRARGDRALLAVLVLGAAGGVSVAAGLESPHPKAEAGFGALLGAEQQTLPTTLRWRARGQVGSEAPTDLDGLQMLMPGQSPAGISTRHQMRGAASPLWCLEMASHRFEDGSWRFEGRLLDAACKQLLGETQTLTPDGREFTLRGQLPDGRPVALTLNAQRRALGADQVLLGMSLEQAPGLAQARWLSLLGTLGQRMSIQSGPDAERPEQTLTLEFTTAPTPQGQARIAARLRQGERVLASPQLITPWSQPARIEWQDDADATRRIALTLTPYRAEPQAGDGR